MPSFAKWIGAFGVVLCLASTALAGEAPCRDKQLEVASLQRAAQAARRLEQALDATGAPLAMVARIGSDVSRYGLRYTHIAFAWRDDPTGRWTVRHALNECAGPTSRLYSQGIMNFFLDDPLSYEALVLVPRPDLSSLVVERLRSGAADGLHAPAYSSVANPWVPRYQNSNQYVLENLAIAHALLRGHVFEETRPGAIAALRAGGYVPSTIRAGMFEMIGANTRANIHLDDRPRASLARLEVVSVESIEAWLARTGTLQARRVVPSIQ